MNAGLRAAVRMAIYEGYEVCVIGSGYNGMISGDIYPVVRGSMANIIQRGGTIIKTGRSQEFMKPEGRSKAYQNLQKYQVDALVCIGGDGSFRGAHALWQEHAVPIVGIPGTIDNDVHGTDFTIGFDTAVNTALEAIDRIRDTAASHDRLFIVEVMGRNAGFIALDVGLAGGAEAVFIPEGGTTVDDAVEQIKRGIARGKMSSILVTGEGKKPGRAYDLADSIRKKSGFDAKVCVLGHVQRGGSPSASDRILASRLGAAAVTSLKSGTCDVMCGIINSKVVQTPLEETFSIRRPVPTELLELLSILAQ